MKIQRKINKNVLLCYLGFLLQKCIEIFFNDIMVSIGISILYNIYLGTRHKLGDRPSFLMLTVRHCITYSAGSQTENLFETTNSIKFSFPAMTLKHFGTHLRWKNLLNRLWGSPIKVVL